MNRSPEGTIRRKKLNFYTNMPTPYQIDFFDELKKYFDLTVIYFTTREGDRQWNLADAKSDYKVIFLKNSWIAKVIQKKVVSFHFSWAIIPTLLRNKPEYIICNGGYYTPNILLILFLNKFRSATVFYWSEPLFRVSNKFSYLIKYLTLFPVRTCTDAILAIGKNAIKCYKSYGYSKHIYNIPYNIDISLFSRERLQPQKRLDFQLNYKSGQEIILITSGALSHRKGVDTLIKAFLKIDQALNARLFIIGDGPDRASLELLAAPSGGRIRFLGFIEKGELPYYFSVADIFVFASRYDGWALVINEALAADLAIICSDQVGAAADKLVHRYNALIFSPEHVDDLHAHMHELIKNKTLRDSLVKNASVLKREISSAHNAELFYGICNNPQ